MTEVKPVEIEDFLNELTEEDKENFGIGTSNGIVLAEAMLAVTVAACNEARNHASSVFIDKNGRYLVVQANYVDGETLTQRFIELRESKKVVDEAFDQLEEQHKLLRTAAERIASWFEMPDGTSETEGKLAYRGYPIAFLDDLEHLKAIASRLYVANTPKPDPEESE